MSKRTLFIASAIILFIISCGPVRYKSNRFEKMKWIEGSWSMTEEGITIGESWVFTGRTGFMGTNHIAMGKDTMFAERMKIHVGARNIIVFDSETGHIKIEASETMQLMKIRNKRFTFKNPNTLKQISYKKRKNNTMQIRIIEPIEGEFTKTTYELHKK
jgi:hypothetical protein